MRFEWCSVYAYFVTLGCIVWQFVSTDPGSTIFGTFLGAFAALWLDNRSDKKTTEAKRSNLVTGLATSFAFNRDKVRQIRKEAGASGASMIDVDLAMLESTTGLRYELLDINLCRRIDELKLQLSALSRRVGIYRELAFDPSTRSVLLTPTTDLHSTTMVVDTSGKDATLVAGQEGKSVTFFQMMAPLITAATISDGERLADELEAMRRELESLNQPPPRRLARMTGLLSKSKSVQTPSPLQSEHGQQATQGDLGGSDGR